MDPVAGKVAFVTGGASGIGLGLSKVLVKAGMKVVIADVREDHLADAAEFFAQGGQKQNVLTLRLDVTDRAAFAQAAQETLRAFGKVHLLVNNAGMGLLGPIKLAKFDDWDWGIGVMITGVVNGIQTFLPHILAHGEGGHIVSTSSMAAVVPIPNCSIYIMAKAALVGLSESLRGELAPDNIGVSAFCPGPVQTNIRESGKTRSGEISQQRLCGARAAPEGTARIHRCGWIPRSVANGSCVASAATTCTSSRTGNSAREPRSITGRCSRRFPTSRSIPSVRMRSASCCRTRSSRKCWTRRPTDRAPCPSPAPFN